MKRFGRIIAGGLLAMGLAVPPNGTAAAGDGTAISIRIRDRVETVVVDAAAVRRIVLATATGDAKPTRADEKAIADAIPAGGPRVPLLVVADVAGDASAAAVENAYKRARAVRTTVSATLGRLPEDQVVVAALVGAKDAAPGAIRLFPILKPAAGAGADGTDLLRALALDTAFLGPTVARLADGAPVAAVPTPQPATATAPVAPTAGKPVAAAPAPVRPAVAPAPVAAPASTPPATPSAPAPATVSPAPTRVTTPPAGTSGAGGTAGRTAPDARPAAAAPAKERTPRAPTVRPAPAPRPAEAAAPRPTPHRQTARPPVAVAPPPAPAPATSDGGCAPPRRIVNDFYPGGPFVPCPR